MYYITSNSSDGAGWTGDRWSDNRDRLVYFSTRKAVQVEAGKLRRRFPNLSIAICKQKQGALL